MMALSAFSLTSIGAIILVALLDNNICDGMSIGQSKVEAENEKVKQNFASFRAPAPVSKPSSSFWNELLGDEFVDTEEEEKEEEEKEGRTNNLDYENSNPVPQPTVPEQYPKYPPTYTPYFQSKNPTPFPTPFPTNHPRPNHT